MSLFVIEDNNSSGIPTCCAVCTDCNSCSEDGKNYCNRNGRELSKKDMGIHRPLNCPIKGEIPDKYGRLIDADAFKAERVKKALLLGENLTVIESFFKDIDDAPTILEATE